MAGTTWTKMKLPLSVMAVVCVVVGVGYVVFEIFIYEPPRIVTSVPGAPTIEKFSPPEEVVVGRIKGAVESLRSEGDWTQVQSGTVLGADDAMRTGLDSEVDLQIGGQSRITVAEASEVMVSEVTDAARRFKLQRGRIAVEYSSDSGRVLQIEDQNGDTVAETKEAKFSVLNTGHSFVVATRTGGVNLKAAGASVEIRPGEQSIVRTGKQPSAVEPIPAGVLLKLARATVPAQKGLCLVVKGKTGPGEEIFIEGERVEVKEDDTFSVPVPRKAGRNIVRVLARNADGKRREEFLACMSQPKVAPPSEQTGPVSDFSVHWNKPPVTPTSAPSGSPQTAPTRRPSGNIERKTSVIPEDRR